MLSHSLEEDKHGLWIFKLDTMNDFINYAERCYNWMHETGKTEVMQLTLANAQLTNCPCSEDRILKDGRFFPYLDQPNCYVSEFPPSGISGTRVREAREICPLYPIPTSTEL